MTQSAFAFCIVVVVVVGGWWFIRKGPPRGHDEFTLSSSPWSYPDWREATTRFHRAGSAPSHDDEERPDVEEPL